jgi:hypothetical protein
MTQTKKSLLFAIAIALIGGLVVLPHYAAADYRQPSPNPASSATTKGMIINGVYYAEDGTYVGIRGDVAATSATACYSDNFTAQTSGKIHSFRTGGTEKAYIDFAGVLNAAGLSGADTTSTTQTVTTFSASALTTGTDVLIKGGSEANVTTAGRYFAVQDSAGAELFGIGADGHQTFAQTTIPVVTNTGGSGPSCVGCTDSNGKIVATTAANTNVITLTFNKSATARGCVISPADANTAVDLKAAGGGVVTMAAGSFTISSPSANWAANQKNIYYSCFF